MKSNDADKAAEFYHRIEPRQHVVEDATITVRQCGQGPNLVFIHGFPTFGFTWRKVLPDLARHFSCTIVDLPGLGDSDWHPHTDFSMTAQSARLNILFGRLELENFALMAHDTGATLARLVALADTSKVSHLIMINTEIPGKRPPWIRTYQFLAGLPGANAIFRQTMKLGIWQRSGMGFGAFYYDRSLFDDKLNLDAYLDPVTSSARNMQGMLQYLKGIEWSVVDQMEQQHAAIKAPTLLLWGEHDRTFPIQFARQMCDQFQPPATLIALPASLMPHEETPEQVVEHVVEFMNVSK